MRTRNTHRRLLTLLSLAMCTSLALLAGCGSSLLADPTPRAPFQSDDQMADAFDQIVPGMTRADDLPGLGFDAGAANVEILSYRKVAQRFARADSAVHACVQAEIYCTGFVFHPTAASNLFERIRDSHPRAADVVLLVMNGRVIGKVISGIPSRDQASTFARVAAAF